MSDGYINDQVKSKIRSVEEAQERVHEQERQREAERVATVQRAEQQEHEKIRQQQEHDAKMAQLNKDVSATLQEPHKKLHAYFKELASNLGIYCKHKVEYEGSRYVGHIYTLQDSFFGILSSPKISFNLHAQLHTDSCAQISITVMDYLALDRMHNSNTVMDYLALDRMHKKYYNENAGITAYEIFINQLSDWPLVHTNYNVQQKSKSFAEYDIESYDIYAASICHTPATNNAINRYLSIWLTGTAEKNKNLAAALKNTRVNDVDVFPACATAPVETYAPAYKLGHVERSYLLAEMVNTVWGHVRENERANRKPLPAPFNRYADKYAPELK